MDRVWDCCNLRFRLAEVEEIDVRKGDLHEHKRQNETEILYNEEINSCMTN